MRWLFSLLSGAPCEFSTETRVLPASLFSATW